MYSYKKDACDILLNYAILNSEKSTEEDLPPLIYGRLASHLPSRPRPSTGRMRVGSAASRPTMSLGRSSSLEVVILMHEVSDIMFRCQKRTEEEEGHFHVLYVTDAIIHVSRGIYRQFPPLTERIYKTLSWGTIQR